MTTTEAKNKIEPIIRDTETFDSTNLPDSLVKHIGCWKWGSYGWTSPASLIFTAAWRKWLYPEMDCCKIWAVDEKKNPIDGGYSIRSEDEAISIPLLAKYDLCNGFCSANSGMQGSRAIEKMRAEKRLSKSFSNTQRTLFDLQLFANILNEINELSSDQALEIVKYLTVEAKKIRDKRIKTNAALEASVSQNFKLMDFLSSTPDPELTKCAVAACFDAICNKNGLTVSGVEDYKTAADARAKKPGDLCLEKDNTVFIAIEVKDKTQEIDWNNIDRAKKIIVANADLVNFIFVLEKRYATVTDTIQEMIKSDTLANGPCAKISFMSIHDLFLLALSISDEKTIATKTGYYLSIAPAVKPETKDKWLKEMK